MKKRIKRPITCFLLVILLSTSVIPMAKAMEIPIIAIEVTAEMLMTAGTCLTGFISTLFSNKFVIQNNQLASCTEPATKPVESVVISSVATDVATHIRDVEKKVAVVASAEKACNAIASEGERVVKKSEASINAASLDATVAISNTVATNIALHELAQIVHEKITEGCPSVGTVVMPLEKVFEVVQTSDGWKLSIPALPHVQAELKFSDKSAENEARAQRIADLAIVQKMRYLLKHDTAYKAMVVKDTQAVIKCLALTQSDDLAESIPACFALEKLYIQAPLHDRLTRTVGEVKGIYFRDGALYDKAFTHKTKASGYIVEFIDDIEKLTHHAISRGEIVSEALYNRLKAIKKTDGEKSSFKYSYRIDSKSFNNDVLSCLVACQQYDFAKAETFVNRYKGNTLFEKIVAQYRQRYQAAFHKAKSSLYDANGIVRIAHNDPAYRLNRGKLKRATDKQKTAINENFLVRHHLKEMMHKKWGISKKVPECVHEALYNLIGSDGVALADIRLLQQKIEKIIDTAEEDEYDLLVKAFYFPNGILKEYAQHFSDIKAVKMPKQILTKSYTALRQQLNNLMSEQLKNSSKGMAIKAAREHLNNWVTAKNSKDAIEAKERFESAYKNIFKTGNAAEVLVPLGMDVVPDVQSSMPMPPPPDRQEPEKVKEIGAVWDMPETGKIIHGRYYTKHALQRMAPDTPQVRAQLFERAQKEAASKGIQPCTEEFKALLKGYLPPRGIPPSVVEETIKIATPIEGEAGTFDYVANGIKVVLNSSGDVITIFPS